MADEKFYVHPTAIVEDGAGIGKLTKIWHFAHVRKGSSIGESCIIGKSVYIDAGCIIGSSVKIQNNVSVFHGVTIEDGVFVGPHVCFTNDRNPRAINPDLSPKDATDWIVTPTLVKLGASIGANSTILSGITLGSWCLVGSGSVVTKTVPPFALVVGNPARIVGIVDKTSQIVSRTYLSGKYQAANGIDMIEIKPEWCEL